MTPPIRMVSVPVIRLNKAEIQSGHDRQKWAEALIMQLPEGHDGRNSWLLNYGEGEIAQAKRQAWNDQARKDGREPSLAFYSETRSSGEPAAPVREEGGAVAKACVDFQRAIDDFEADVADVMAEGSERADLWDREITVNIDALKTVMSAALATREEAPAEAGEPSLVDWFSQFVETYQEGCGPETDALIACLDRVRDSYRAQPQAREEAQPVGYCDPTHLTRIKREAEARGEASSVIYGYPAGTYRTPLYTTPPAPEAEKLRIAVEALEAIEQIRSEMVMVPIDSEAANAWANALGRAADMAAQALAALQQEGR